MWDPLVRIFHWSLVVGFFISYFAHGEWMGAHVWAGYIVFIWLSIRLVWGFTGTRHARFHNFVFPPRTVLAYLKQVFSFKAKRYLGHNPAGGLMIILLITLTLTTTVSGMMLYGADAWLGPLTPLMKNADESTTKTLIWVHEYSADGTLLLVLVHVAGVLWDSVVHRENLLASMITGRKREIGSEK